MRTVLKNHNEVAHYWAHNRQTEGRSSNMFFEGDTIYSYGKHFPIARRVTEDLFLFTTDGYSSSTSKHKSITLNAIPHSANVFHVPNVWANSTANHSQNFEDYKKQFQNWLNKANRARKYKTAYLLDAHKTANEANKYAETFGLKVKIDTSSIDIEAIKAEIAEQQRIEQEAEKKRQAELAVENADKIKRWKQGESVSIPWNINKIYLRLKNDRLETSRGVSIDLSKHLSEIKTTLHGIDICRKAKRTARPINYVIDKYRVQKIDADGNITIGCHFIEFDEIEAITQNFPS